MDELSKAIIVARKTRIKIIADNLREAIGQLKLVDCSNIDLDLLKRASILSEVSVVRLNNMLSDLTNNVEELDEVNPFPEIMK